MNPADLHRALGPMRRRIGAMFARGTISAIDDGPQAQELQVELLDGEAHDKVERFQEYGFSSVPHPGAEAAIAFVGGLRSHGIVIAVEDRRYRAKALQKGEVAVYDDQGQTIVLKRDGIEIITTLKVTIDAGDDVVVRSAGSITVEAETVNLGGDGGEAIARIGDTVAGGVITSGSSKVKAA